MDFVMRKDRDCIELYINVLATIQPEWQRNGGTFVMAKANDIYIGENL